MMIISAIKKPLHAAVLDVGSGSVRLQGYKIDSSGRVKQTFAGVSACGLGRLPLLSDSATDCALVAIENFSKLCAFHDVPLTNRFAVATAAVRIAPENRREKFINDAQKIWGQPIDVISGKEEAALFSKGLIGYFPDISGMALDMGGRSLEVVQIQKGIVKASKSFEFGAFALPDSPDDLRIRAYENFSKLPRIFSDSQQDLYLSGGPLRALVRAHFSYHLFQLRGVFENAALKDKTARQAATLETSEVIKAKTIHGESINPRILATTLDVIIDDIKKDPELFFERYDIHESRRETFISAAYLLKYVLERFEPKSVIATQSGLREGVLYDRLSARSTLEIDAA